MKRHKKEKSDENGFEGGYMSAKISKLDEQFRDVASKLIGKESNIFSGISIFVNGWTNPTSIELKSIMAQHGGVYHHYHKPGITMYVIATNLPDVKIKSLTTCKIVRPEWITESLKEGRLLDYSNYLLYTNQNKTQPRLPFKMCIKPEMVKADSDSISNSPDLFVSSSDEQLSGDSVIAPDALTSDKRSHSDKTHSEISDAVNAECVSVTSKSNIDKNDTAVVACKNTSSVAVNEQSRPTKTAKDPDFMSEFYNNSRLHHISTLGASFKQHINELRESSNGVFECLDRLKALSETSDVVKSLSTKRTIMHIDMDCFFVSVGLRSRPDLRGKPVAVAHAKGNRSLPENRPGVDRNTEIKMYNQRMQDKIKKIATNTLNFENDDLAAEYEISSRLDGIEEFNSMSEIASCNYEARTKGLKNGMFLGSALKLCPELQTIPYDFEGYKEVAYTLYNTVAEYTLNIEAVSCDELFVDVTEVLRQTSLTSMEFSEHLRNEIKRKTLCPCSTGFGANKLQARLATRKAKPDGAYHLEAEDVEQFMNEIAIADLPGVGRSTTAKLTLMGLILCGDLKSLSLSDLQKEFGTKSGESLYNHCRGIDDRPLVYEQVRISVSAEINYGIRFTTAAETETFLHQLAREVHSRLSEVHMKGRCITLKLMVRAKDAPLETAKYMGHGFCDNLSKSSTLQTATNDIEVITRAVLTLSKSMNVAPTELRGVGIQISRLESNKKSAGNTKGGLRKFFKSNGSCNKGNSCNDATSIETDVRSNGADATKKLTVESVETINITDALDTLEISKEEITITNPSSTAKSDVSVNDLACKSRKQNKTTRKSKSPKKDKSKGVRKGRKNTKQGNNNVLHKFFVTQKNNQSSAFKKSAKDSNKLDHDVLASLPDEIRAEVLRDHKLHEMSLVSSFPTSVDNNIKIDQHFLEALPEDIRKELEADIGQYQMAEDNINIKLTDTNKIKSTTRDASANGSNIKSCIVGNDVNKTERSKEVLPVLKWSRALLRDWIMKEPFPENCDIEMLTKYAQSLITDRKLEEIYVLLKFIFRIISELSSLQICAWHAAYLIIVENVQVTMKEIYKEKLAVQTNFKCRNCQ